MTIKTNLGGVAKPIDRSIAILWYAEATSYATLKSDIESMDDKLSEISGLTSAGSISIDGISISANVEEGEIYEDWSHNKLDQAESSSTPTISFQLLEALNTNAVKLAYKDVEGSAGERFRKITGTASPTPKLFVIEYRIKDAKIRVIFPECSFASRDDRGIANDALASIGVKYSILKDETTLTGEVN